MRKILIALLFIVSIVAISCQLDTTRPKRKSTAQDNSEETVGTGDLANISIDLGEGQNRYSFDVPNSWKDTTLLLPLAGDNIEDIIDGLNYEITSATIVGGRNVNDWVSISTKTETDGNKKGPRLTIHERVKNEISLYLQREVEVSILVTNANNDTATLKVYLFFNRIP